MPENTENGSGAYDSLLDSSCDTTAAPAALYVNKVSGNPTYCTAAVKKAALIRNEAIYSGGSVKNAALNTDTSVEDAIYNRNYNNSAAIYSSGSIKSAVYAGRNTCEAPNFPIDEAVRLLQQQ